MILLLLVSLIVCGGSAFDHCLFCSTVLSVLASFKIILLLKREMERERERERERQRERQSGGAGCFTLLMSCDGKCTVTLP